MRIFDKTPPTTSVVWSTLRELELSLSTAAQDLIVQLEQTDPALAKTDSRKTLELLVLAPTERPMLYDKRQESRWRALRQDHGLQHLQQVCQDARLWPLLAAWWQHYGLSHDALLPLTPTELASELPVDLLIEHSAEMPQWMLWLSHVQPQLLECAQWSQLHNKLLAAVKPFLTQQQDFLAWLKLFQLVPFWHTVSPEQTGKTAEQILFSWIAENPLERFPAFYQRLQVFSKPELRTFIGIARLCDAWHSDWLDVLAPYADTWQYWQTALQQLDAPLAFRPEHSLTALPKAFERAMRQEIHALPEFIRLTEQPDFVHWYDSLRRSDNAQGLIYRTFGPSALHATRWRTLEQELKDHKALALQAGTWSQRYAQSAPRLNATVKWQRAWEIDQAYKNLDTLDQAWSEVSLGQEVPWQPWTERLLQHLTDLATQPWSRLKDTLPTAVQLLSRQNTWQQEFNTTHQHFFSTNPHETMQQLDTTTKELATTTNDLKTTTKQLGTTTSGLKITKEQLDTTTKELKNTKEQLDSMTKQQQAMGAKLVLHDTKTSVLNELNAVVDINERERKPYREKFEALLKPIFNAQPAHWVLLQTHEELEAWNDIWRACGRLHVLWWSLHQQLLRHPQLLCQALLTTEIINGLSESLAASQLGDKDQQTLKQAILPTDMTQTALTWADSRWQTVDHRLQGFLSAPSPASTLSPAEANAASSTSQALEALSHTLAHLPWTLWADSLADWLYELREDIREKSATTAALPTNIAPRQLTP